MRRTHFPLSASSRFLVALIVGFVFSIMALSVPPVQAAAFVVNSLANTDDGTCNAAHCTLREAINAANAAGGSNSITFSVNGTILLTSNLPEISGTLSITGNGTGQTILSGNNARRVLTQASGTLTLQALTVRDGNNIDTGGGLYAGGTATLINVNFTNNRSTNLGGGIFSASGNLTISTNSTFSSNRADGEGGGAVFVNGGSLAISGSSFVGNSGAQKGGAVFTQLNSSVTVSSSTFTTNTAGNIGGAVYAYNSVSVTVSSSTFSSNQATNAWGGAVFATGGSLAISGSSFNSNSSGTSGGAVFVIDVASATVSSSTFTTNSTTSAGAGVSVENGTVMGSLTITGSTFTGNSAGNAGAVFTYRSANAQVINSLFVNNNASYASVDSSSGIYHRVGTMTIRNTTLTGNQRAAISGFEGTVNIYNTIAANSTGTNCVRSLETATINAQNSLLEGSLACVNGTNTNNLTGDPALDASYRLTSGSIAVNAGDNALISGYSTDLAGNPRIQQTTVDMGAYESTFAPTPVVTISPASFNVNEGSSANFTITRVGSLVSALPVTVNIAQGTGTVTADYSLSGGSISGQSGNGVTVTIPAGSASVNVSMSAVNDVDAEADNTLTMTLVDTAAYNLGATTSSTATIPVNDTVVTTTSDSGDGSLRQAITNANAFAGADTITFTINGTFTLASALPDLTDSLTITGNGISNTLIGGNNAVRVFNMTGGTSTIQNVTIRFGSAAEGAGIRKTGGTLTVLNSAFTSNVSSGAGGGIANTGGALTVTNSRFSGNSAATGGAVSGSDVTLNDSTLSGNTATNGGGLYVSGGTAALNNSLIANSTGGECVRAGGTINAQHSLIEDGLTCVSGTNVNNLTGDPALNADLTLSSTSIAINAGNNSLIPGGVTTDLAGNARIRQGTVDMGAYESAYVPPAPTVTISAVDDTGAEAGTDAITFRITRSTTSASALTVNYTIGGTATNGTDYTPTLTGAASIPANVTFVDVVVTPSNDANLEGNETITLTLVSSANYNLGSPSSAQGTIIDDDATGITVSPTNGLTTTEAGGTATFTLVLNTQPTADVTIGLSSSDTTEGLVSPASVTFTAANWNVAQTVTVTGVNDVLVDGSVAYSIVTDAAVSADASYNGVNPADVSVTNTDDDTAGITINPASGLVTTEAGGTAEFTIVLNTQPTANVTIGVSSSDTTEGTVLPINLTFTTANWNVAQTVTVTGVDDALIDGNIAYTIITAAAVSSDLVYNGVNPADVSVTNNDDDTVGITVTPTGGLVTTEAGGTATFTLVLKTQPSANVTIGVSSSDTTEGTAAPNSVTFTTANWNVAQTVTVTGVDDVLVDGSVAYTIITAAAVSGDPAYNGVNPADVSVTNSDNDAVGITINPTSGLVTTEAGGTATFTVVLNMPPTANVTIGLSSSLTTEGTVAPNSLTFTTANWNVAQTVTVTGVNDAQDDDNAAYTIITAAAVSSDMNFSGINPSDVSVTNTDDDTAGITVNPTGGLVTTEAGGTATFTIVLNTQPTAGVIINLSTGDTSEGSVSPSSVIFSKAGWNIAQTVTVTGVNDVLDDGDISFSIVTAAAVSSDAKYNGMNPANVSVTNIDDDTAGITVNPTGGLVTTEAGGTATFTIVLNTRPTANVTIDLTSSDTSEGTVSPASVTFAPPSWNTAKTVTITGVNDVLDDGDIAYNIVTAAAVSSDANYNGMNPANVSVSNTDDDVAGITVNPAGGLVTTEAGGTATFTIVLNTQPTAGVTIGLSSSDTSEGTVSPASATFTTANWNVVQTVTVTGVDDALDDGNVGYAVITAAMVSSDASYNGVNPADISVTNNNDDTAGITVTPTNGLVTTEVGGTATFTLVLNTQPSDDVTIAVSSSDTSEGTVSPNSVTFTSANWNVAQTVTVTGVDDAVDDGNVGYSIVTAAAVSSDLAYNGFNAANVSVTNDDDNDTAGIAVNPTGGLVTTEAGDTATFTIALNTQPTANVTIDVSSSDTSEGTVSPASVTFTSANWNSAQTVVVTGADDALDDGDIGYTIITAAAVSADPNYSGINPADISASNSDNDSAGITVDPTSSLTTTEAGGTATFTLVLNTQPTANVTIDVSSSDTSEGTVSPASVTFTSANWNTAQPVTITGVDDVSIDGDSAYTIITAAAVSSDPNYSGLNPSDVSISNSDDDSAGITVNPTGGLVTLESGTTAQFTIALNTQPSADVSFNLMSEDTSEGTISPDNVTFTDANWNQPQTITVTGVDDALVDGNITYLITTGLAASGDTNYEGINPDDVEVTNNDDDTAGITVSPTSGLVTTEAGGMATFTMALNTQPSANVTIDLTSSDTGEGTVSPASVTFTTANWNTAQTVTITGVNDALDDGNVAYTILTAAAISSDPAYNGVNPADVSVSNTDDDTAGITVSPTNGLVTTEPGGTAEFTIVLNTQPTADVTIGLSSSDTSEGTVSPTSLTFTDVDWNQPQTVTITGVNDVLDDGNVAYSIVTAAAVSGDPNYSGLNPSDVSVSNTDDDNAGITVNPTNGLTTTEAGGTATFTLVLNTQPSATVTIDLTSSDTSEGMVSPASVTFTGADWNQPQTVTITGVNDALDDGNVGYSIVTVAAVSSDPNYSGLNPADVGVTNTDDDNAGITVTPTNGLVTTEAGGTAEFTIVLNTQPTADVTIGVSSSDTSEGTVSPAQVTFTSANWNVAQTVTATGVDDVLDDGNVGYTIITAAVVSSDPNYSGLNPTDVSVTNNDDDSAGITVNPTSGLVTTEAGGTAEFTVVLNTQPSANVTIDLTSSDTTEGTVAPAQVTFTPADWNQPQTVTVTGVNDVLDDGNIGYTVITAAAVSSDPNYSGFNPADVSVTNTDDDTAGVAVNPTGALVTTEAGGTATFTLVLNTQPTADVSIAVSSSATDEGTVLPISVTFTSANWNTAQTVTVTGVDDALDDGNVGYTILTAAAVSSDPNYSGLNPADVSVTNNDDDSAGITVAPTNGLITTEAGGTAVFTIVLNTQPTADVTIGLSSSDTSEGTVSPTSLTFTDADWNQPQTVTVTGVNDALDDGNIAYTVITAGAASSDANYSGMNPADVSATNNDDDDAGITVNPIAGLVTLESGTTAQFTIVLNTQPSANVSFNLMSEDTGEGTISPDNITFTNANWNQPQTITVTGVDDALLDGNITYIITTGLAASSDPNYSGLNPADVTVTNNDDDTAGITVSPTSGLITTEAGGAATFTVVLNAQPAADVTISVSSSDPSEGTVAPASVTFTTANWNVAQTVTITGVNDALDDGNIAYSIVTAAVVSSDPVYNGVNPADVSVTNTNDDTAGISVTPMNGLTTTEAGGTAEFAIVLNTQPTADVTIDLSSSDPSEGAVSPASVTFTTANWNVVQTVTITGVDDALDDGNVGYTILTAAAVSSDPNYSGLNPSDVSVTNTDNDNAGITVNPTGGLVTTEAGGTAMFTVVLNTQPSANVTINLSSSDTTEGTVSPNSVTFTSANWNTAQTVTVTGVDDVLADGNVGYSIITAAAVSSDPNYSGLNPSDVSVTNNDNDNAGITVNPTNGLVTTEAGGTATFTVVLNTQPTANVTLGLSSSDTTEGTVSPAQVTFTSANWNTAQTVTVTGVDDAVDDGNVGYTILTAAAVSSDPNYSGLNPSDVSVTNNDNDNAGITVNPTGGLVTTEVGGTATFTVVLNTQPTANVTIDLTSSDTGEGTVAPAQVTFTSANWNVAQTVTVTGVDDLLDDGNIGYSIITAAAVSSDPNYSGLNPADVNLTNNDNDSAGITVNPTSSLVTTETGGTAQFTVVLNTQPTADVTIGVSSSDTGEGTVAPAQVTFTTANWNVAQTVTVTGVDDLLVDGNIGYSIVTAAAVSSDPNYSGLNPADVSVTNSDDDGAGITINPTGGLVTTEAGGTAQFTVVLNTQPSANVTINLTSSDTGEGTVAPANLTFTTANWNVAQTVTVTGVDDVLDDGNVGYTILTAAAVSSDPNYSGLNPADVSVTNNDNDNAGITVNPTGGLVTTEAGGTAQFTVVLNTQPTADVTIGVSSSDTTEGTVSPAQVTFTSANWNTAQTVTVTGVDDVLDDGNVGYTILTAAAVSSDPNYSGLNPADVSVTNNDNDNAGITVNPTGSLVTTEAGGTATFTLVLNTQPSANVTIDLTSSDTGEGTVSPAQVTFTSANWNIAQTVTVTGVDDAVDDGNIGYTILTSVAVSSDPNYSGLNPADVSVTNNDDDNAGITVNPTGGLVTTEAGGQATFTLRLTSQPTADVGIILSSSDTTEGTVAPLALTFTPANWNVAQTVTVTGVDDALDDGAVTYGVNVTTASGDPLYNGVSVPSVGVTNNDDDASGIRVNPTGGLVTTEAGGTAQFTVVLNTQPSADVTIDLSSSDTSEGTVAPAQVTFTSANWNVAQTVTVTGMDDGIDDGDISYTVMTALAVSADATYGGLDAADVSLSNTDDDTAGISITPNLFYMTESSAPQTYHIAVVTEPSAPFTLALTFDPTQLSVDGSSTSPVLYTFTSGGVIDIPVAVVENDAVNTDRVAVIAHRIVSSSAPEYPVLELASVTINIGDAPPPPSVPTCEAHNFDAGGVVRSSAPDAISYALNCRVLYQNGTPTSWLNNPLYSEANLGVAGLLELGVQQAVDIFSPTGMTYFEGGAVFCVRGSGTLIWLAASGAPRVPQIIGSYTVEPFPGFTCATLFEPGTLILVSDNPLD